MKGNNMIYLNETTVIAAVQMYLDAQFKEGASPVVSSFKSETSGAYDKQGMYVVTLSDVVPKAVG